MACKPQPGARTTRRCLRLAALAAVAGAGWLMAVPAAAAPDRPAVPVAAAQAAAPVAAGQAAAQAQPWIAITSMSPTIAGPKGKITVSGIVANPTGSPLAGLSVQLWSSSYALTSRQSMNSYLTSQGPASVEAPVAGTPLTLRSRVP